MFTDPRLRFSIESAAKALDCSTRQLWRKVAAGEIKTQQDGRKHYVTRAELERVARGEPGTLAPPVTTNGRRGYGEVTP